MLQKMISPYQAMMKTISDSLTADSKTALAIAFAFGYLIDKILRNTILKGHCAKSSEHVKNLDRNSSNKEKHKDIYEYGNDDDKYKNKNKKNHFYDFDDDYDDDDDDYDYDDDDDEQEEYGDGYMSARHEEYKMVFAINSELKMGKGKVAAQCAHAAIAAFKMANKKNPAIVKCWSESGQPKITLKVDNENQLVYIEQKAKKMNLITEVIRDAGRTQIPAGSRTVCVIGPGPIKLIDEITGTLKLY